MTPPVTDPAAVAATVRDAALAVPGVIHLTPGSGVEVATQFAGGKVTGVRLGDHVEVHVAVDRSPITLIAEQVWIAVRTALDGSGQVRPVEVVVDDVDLAVLTAGVPGR